LFYLFLLAFLLSIDLTFAAQEKEVDPEQVKREMFQGSYFGGRVGINNSSATGANSAPAESTIAYIVQGGYLQTGHNIKLGDGIIGLGAYVDMHGYEKHKNEIRYGVFSYGLNAKFGRPIDDWLPYVKVGYGHNYGTGDLSQVNNAGVNKSIGLEYNLNLNWGLVAEYKFNNFGNKTATIHNKTFMFGFNYYPKEVAIIKLEEIDYTKELPPEKIEDVPPEFAPPP